ncbi:MAG: hypothetical protein WAT66_14525 [Actinomycetota bacterium]
MGRHVTSYLCRGCGLLLPAYFFGIRRTGERAGQRFDRCKQCDAQHTRAYTKRKKLEAQRVNSRG